MNRRFTEQRAEASRRLTEQIAEDRRAASAQHREAMAHLEVQRVNIQSLHASLSELHGIVQEQGRNIDKLALKTRQDAEHIRRCAHRRDPLGAAYLTSKATARHNYLLPAAAERFIELHHG